MYIIKFIRPDKIDCCNENNDFYEKVIIYLCWLTTSLNNIIELLYHYLTFTSFNFQVENSYKETYVEEVDWQRGPLLGSGGSSTCFQARDIATGILMAVKQVQLEAYIDVEMRYSSSLYTAWTSNCTSNKYFFVWF